MVETLGRAQTSRAGADDENVDITSNLSAGLMIPSLTMCHEFLWETYISAILKAVVIV